MALASLPMRAQSRRLIPTRSGTYHPTSTSRRFRRRSEGSDGRTLSSSTTAGLGIEGEPTYRGLLQFPADASDAFRDSCYPPVQRLLKGLSDRQPDRAGDRRHGLAAP